MNQFLSEIHEKYTKIVKSANLIGFLNRLVFPLNLIDSQPLDIYSPREWIPHPNSLCMSRFDGNCIPGEACADL